MIASHLPMNEFVRLADYMLLGAVNAIRKDLQSGAQLHEPDYLAAIVTKFPALMNGNWGNVKFGGCFIHQSPYVAFEEGNSCEAGDLLVLCRNSIAGEISLNATLFQLKRAHKDWEFMTPDNQKQFRLYSEWPKFSIGRRFDSDLPRNIEPKAVTPGAQYMFINDNSRYHWHFENSINPYWSTIFTHSIPHQFMDNRPDMSLGRFLWNFINWQTGRPIAFDEEFAYDDWSRFIWDIIVRTRFAKISNSHTGINKKHNIDKHQGDFFRYMTFPDCFYELPLSYLDGISTEEGNGKRKKASGSEEYEGAMSILFIDMGEHVNNE